MPTLKETIASPFKKAKKFLSKNKKAKDADAEVPAVETNGEAAVAVPEDTTNNACTDAVNEQVNTTVTENGDSKPAQKDTPKETAAPVITEAVAETKPTEPEESATSAEEKKEEA
jgi:hypothetical protein